MNTKKVKSKTSKFLEKINKGPLTFQKLMLSLREAEAISQKDFAEQLGISKQHLCDIEKGRRLISIEKAAFFAEQLGYPAETFVSLVIQDQIRDAGLTLNVKIS